MNNINNQEDNLFFKYIEEQIKASRTTDFFSMDDKMKEHFIQLEKKIIKLIEIISTSAMPSVQA